MDLVTYRSSRELSQKQCAVAVGVASKSYISGLETGAVHASIRLALRIQAWSGGAVRAEDLVGPEDAELLRSHRQLAGAPRGAVRVGAAQLDGRAGA